MATSGHVMTTDAWYKKLWTTYLGEKLAISTIGGAASACLATIPPGIPKPSIFVIGVWISGGG